MAGKYTRGPVLWAFVWVGQALAAGNALAANEPAAPAAPAKPAISLAAEQRQVAERFERLKEKLLRMAELTAGVDPRRAALLRKAVAQANDRGIDAELTQLVDQLEHDRLSAALKAEGAVHQDLVRLLDLLLSEDRSKRIQSEKERLREYIKRINKIIAAQKELQGQSSGDEDPAKLGQQQDRLAEKTGQLARDIQSSEGPKPSPDADESQPAAGKGKKPSGDRGNKKPGKDRPSSEKDSPEGDKPGDDAGGDDKSGDDKSAAEQKPADGKNQPASGKPSGEKSGKPAEGEAQPAEGEPADGQESAGGQDKPERGKPAGGKPEGDKPNPSGQPEAGGEPQPADGKSQGKPSKGKSSGKPGGKSQGQDSGGDDQEEQDENQDGGEPAEQNPAQKRIEQAEQRMREAQRQLEAAKRHDAVEKQEEAKRELELAKAELEAILRQLREEEVARMLAQLEGRFRKMLDTQIEVYEGTKRVDKVPQGQRDRDHEIEAGRLSRKEAGLVSDADKALAVLHEEGSSVALPEAVGDMRDDMEQVVIRLSEAKVGQMTQGLEEDIIVALEEMIAALQKAQKELEKKAGQNSSSPGGTPGEPPLVDQIAEIKMIRSMQMWVNKRTQRYAALTKTEQTEQPELLQALERLSEREDRIRRITRDIVVGRNE